MAILTRLRWLAGICVLITCILIATGCAARRSIRPTTSELNVCSRVGIGADACELVKAEAGSTITVLRAIDDLGHEREDAGIQFAVPGPKADAVLMALRPRLKAKGCLAFRCHESYDINGKPDRIGVIKTDDQYQILRISGTSAPNYDMTQSAILAKLKKWERKYPFEIIGAEQDSVELRFSKVPSDLPDFAKEVYSFCPDIVDQGAGSASALADEIRRSKTLFLWWD